MRTDDLIEAILEEEDRELKLRLIAILYRKGRKTEAYNFLKDNKYSFKEFLEMLINITQYSQNRPKKKGDRPAQV